MLTPEEVAALADAEGLDATANNLARLAKIHGMELSSWAATMWSIRERAKAKFPKSRDLFFTRNGYEMASSSVVAAWHASLFPSGESVVDLCCGIGSDLMALAQKHQVTGVDSDPDHVRMARLNLQVSGLAGEVIESDGIAWLQANKPKYFFADPARREGVQRITNPAEFSPNFQQLMPHIQQADMAVIKTSTGLRNSDLQEMGGKCVFVSHQGSCCEAALIFGGDTGWWAYHIESDSWMAGSPDGEYRLPERDDIRSYFYEADPALIRADGLMNLGLDMVGTMDGYLTGDDRIDSPWLRGYEVVWHDKFSERAVKQELKRRAGKLSAVKTRAHKVDAHTIERRLKCEGDESLVLAVYELGPKLRSVLLRPL